jgi:hypothetical protein
MDGTERTINCYFILFRLDLTYMRMGWKYIEHLGLCPSSRVYYLLNSELE